MFGGGRGGGVSDGGVGGVGGLVVVAVVVVGGGGGDGSDGDGDGKIPYCRWQMNLQQSSIVIITMISMSPLFR